MAWTLKSGAVTITEAHGTFTVPVKLTRRLRKQLRKKKPQKTVAELMCSRERRAFKRSIKRKEMLVLLDDAFSVALTAKFTRMRPTFRTIAA